jgi:uncharacterized membrane protein YecN with MAPEG domain
MGFFGKNRLFSPFLPGLIQILVGRVLHALGLLFQTGPSLGRVIGMLLTWVALLSAAVGLIAFAVV